MATNNRTPASPTLTAITDDAARGGLFSVSNVANPVEGADITGTTVNNGMITLQLNGTTVGQFSVNQAENETINFMVEASSSGGGGGDPVIRGMIDGTDILLVKQSSAEVRIPIGSLATDAELQAVRDAIPTSVYDFSDTPGAVGGNGQVLGVENGTLAFVTPDTATVSESSFFDTPTVTFATEGTQVRADATPTWVAPGGTGGVSGTIQVASLTVDSSTGFILQDNGSGSYTLRTPTPPAQPARAPVFTQPPPSDALSQSPAIVERITAEGGTFNSVTADVTPPSGASPVTPTVTGPGGGPVMPGDTVATITIPMGDANAPGDYMIRATTMTLGADNMVRTDNPEITVNRFIPFLRSRSDIMAQDSTGVELSGAAFSGTIEALPGRGLLYFAVENGAGSAMLQNTIRRARDQMTTYFVQIQFVRAIQVTLADTTQRTFNVFRTAISDGVTIGDFS